MNELFPYNHRLKDNSRRLRSNQTDAEKRLWSRLRRKQLNGRQFYRQKPLEQFIVDFYAPSVNLVIEVDGGQHFTDEGKATDDARDQYFDERGLTILRFTNLQVLKELEHVMAVIEVHTR